MKNGNVVVKRTVILNLIQDLQRLPLRLLNSIYGGFQIKFGMTPLFDTPLPALRASSPLRARGSSPWRGKVCEARIRGERAFTLIELLVVVLIIGILAAVAVPQYQKAVGKARLAEVKSIVPTYLNAIHLTYLETGEKNPHNNTLSIDLPSSKNWHIDINECVAANGVYGCSILCYGKNNLSGIYIIFEEKDYFIATNATDISNTDRWHCSDDNDGALCRNLGFTQYDEGEDIYLEP